MLTGLREHSVMGPYKSGFFLAAHETMRASNVTSTCQFYVAGLPVLTGVRSKLKSYRFRRRRRGSLKNKNDSKIRREAKPGFA